MEVCVKEVVVVLVKISLLLSGSRADCEDRLNTEPQSIDLVLLPSTSSPKVESLSFVLFTEFTELLLADPCCEAIGVGVVVTEGKGKGVARPEDVSLSG